MHSVYYDCCSCTAIPDVDAKTPMWVYPSLVETACTVITLLLNPTVLSYSIPCTSRRRFFFTTGHINNYAALSHDRRYKRNDDRAMMVMKCSSYSSCKLLTSLLCCFRHLCHSSVLRNCILWYLQHTWLPLDLGRVAWLGIFACMQITCVEVRGHSLYPLLTPL